ncbi:MAG: 3-dehydroquinate synthase [Bacillota bacterium]|nr:3-dehydroquinate synthase [Bacillota bacterium]
MKELLVNLPEKSYPIYIEKGLFDSIGEEIKKIYKGRKIAIITDENLDRIYGEKLSSNLEKNEFTVKKVVVKPGEKSKSIDVLLRVYDELLDFSITRGDLIIAFGGGVVGDLTGFAASTLLRGIPFVQIPTSLLAQIDSSIGGKVAVDLPKGKNLVGSFYHPNAVFIDPELLKTLDKRFLHDGMAEVVKYGAIRNKELFDELLSFKGDDELLENIEGIIYTCCDIKRQIVEKDEKDTGLRMILNYGHTIGHAVEKYFNYETYTHGEGVAVGMYTITKRSEELDITEAGTADLIKQVLVKYQLPFEISGLDKSKILQTVGLDKKNKGDNMSIILISKIGDGFIKDISRSEMEQYI